MKSRKYVTPELFFFLIADFLAPLTTLIFIIRMHLLHIIPHVCAENLSPMSPISLVILIKLICYETTAIALVCNECTVVNVTLATTLR